MSNAASLSLLRDFRPSLGGLSFRPSPSSMVPFGRLFVCAPVWRTVACPPPQCHTRGDKHFPALKIETGKSRRYRARLAYNRRRANRRFRSARMRRIILTEASLTSRAGIRDWSLCSRAVTKADTGVYIDCVQ